MMTTHKTKSGERIFILKIIQSNLSGRVRGLPYRVLAVPEHFTLYQFAEAINDSFDFDFDHPFGFYDNLKRYYRSMEAYELFTDLPDIMQFGSENRYGSVEKTRVNQVFTHLKKKMLYLFDYGDEWHFLIQLTGVEPVEQGRHYPVCLKTVGEALPQYEDFDEEEGDDDDDDEEEDRQVQ